jgi:hypothetical protein
VSLWPEDVSPFGAVFDAASVRDQAAPQLPGVLFRRHELYPKQAAIVDDPHRFTITEATTKAGKTMSHVEWLLERTQARGRGNSWWVATVSGTAQIAYRRTIERLRGYLESGRKKIQVGEPIPFRKHDTERWIDVFGARIWFKSAEKPDNLYGDDVHDAVGDEITRWREAAWHALYTTLSATGGQAKLIGNVKGRRNFAYKLARKAETGEPDWGYHRLTAQDAIAGGVLDSDVVQQAKRDLPAAVYRELYEAEASDDEGNPFGIEAIKAIRLEALSDQPVVAYGLDLAKSVDWCVLTGFDAEGREARHERWQGPWKATVQRVRARVGDVPCLVDSTGVGDPILEELQADGRQNFTGFKFTATSKQQLMEGLQLAIQTATIRVFSAATISELEAFEYQYTRTGVRYSAPEGVHDDCVCSLALARAALAELQRGTSATALLDYLRASRSAA